jgi:hypothetical protein
VDKSKLFRLIASAEAEKEAAVANVHRCEGALTVLQHLLQEIEKDGVNKHESERISGL